MAQRERIIEEAALMFAQQGIKSVRMDDIATELSVSKRTLYALFGDKEELIYQSILHLLERQREMHSRIMQEAENELEAIFKIMELIHKEARVATRVENNLKKFYPQIHDRIQGEGLERNRQGLFNLLERGGEKGLFRREQNCEMTVALFYSMGYAIKESGFFHIPEEMSEEQAFFQVITTLFRGISTPKGIEIIDRYTENIQR